MSDTHTDVPSVLTAPLPIPVPLEEHRACPVTDVLRRAGDRWSVLIMILLGKRSYRFNELHRSIEGISQRMLTRTLRGLERDGLVSRTVHPSVPPTVEYDLTSLGRTFLGPLSTLADWAVLHDPDIAAARERHDAHSPH
ncbi:helix-turn-helix transcriptional regulator [Actinoallomurus purpureus]|uniref:winged helix-turn-helix transcriptional regulator n=1 Tax=Actinoallomurus purpureus TaxID=478114 RepID=UPI002091EB0D|nr:helix-turn-helix domain-containing protein [Actinoallomurus purpureus]MCO6006549.1 helix-turn-helix transcriptional regulator [Actinoallomurus purpureus]